MKTIKYKVLDGMDPNGTAVISNISMTWSEKNEELARAEAMGGEITIEDDGTVETPSQLDIIEAQITYTAMMTDTLLEV